MAVRFEVARARECISLFALACSTAIFSLLVYYCHYGFDITDEELYMVSIANPLLYSDTIFFYGLVYNPLFSLVGDT